MKNVDKKFQQDELWYRRCLLLYLILNPFNRQISKDLEKNYYLIVTYRLISETKNVNHALKKFSIILIMKHIKKINY